MLFTAHFSSICSICKIQTSCPNTSNCHEILHKYSPVCQYKPQKFRSQRINPWFTKNHVRQHTQICPNRISCNLEIKRLFLYSSKCYETTSITTMSVLEFIKTTPSILIHRKWFNTDFPCCRHQICHSDNFSICFYKIIN